MRAHTATGDWTAAGLHFSLHGGRRHRRVRLLQSCDGDGDSDGVRSSTIQNQRHSKQRARARRFLCAPSRVRGGWTTSARSRRWWARARARDRERVSSSLRRLHLCAVVVIVVIVRRRLSTSGDVEQSVAKGEKRVVLWIFKWAAAAGYTRARRSRARASKRRSPPRDGHRLLMAAGRCGVADGRRLLARKMASAIIVCRRRRRRFSAFRRQVQPPRGCRAANFLPPNAACVYSRLSASNSSAIGFAWRFTAPSVSMAIHESARRRRRAVAAPPLTHLARARRRVCTQMTTDETREPIALNTQLPPPSFRRPRHHQHPKNFALALAAAPPLRRRRRLVTLARALSYSRLFLARAHLRDRANCRAQSRDKTCVHRNTSRAPTLTDLTAAAACAACSDTRSLR